jgi:hypothetical protein
MEEKEVIKSIDQAWQDLLFPNWMIPATTTATTMETANIDPEDFTDTNQFARKSFADVTVLVPFQLGSGKPNLYYPYEDKKYLWRKAISSGFAYTSGMMPIIYQVLEDDLGFPGEAVGSVSPWPVLWRQSEPQPADLRGVFRTNYPRKVLFTKPVTFKTSELPRWKPKTIIGLRAFEEKDA